MEPDPSPTRQRPDKPMTLTCSAKRKFADTPCWSLAVWAMKAGDTWHGACHQHPHQVLKRLGGEGAPVTVQLATVAMAENHRLRNLPSTLSRAEEMLDSVRQLVHDDSDPAPGTSGRDEVWTAARVRAMLTRRTGDLVDDAFARELLELLCEENVVEHQGEGNYLYIAGLPR